jgi:hypothetical protein
MSGAIGHSPYMPLWLLRRKRYRLPLPLISPPCTVWGSSFLLWRKTPSRAQAASLLRFPYHAQ